MATISDNDTIFATLMNRGRVVAEATLTGVSSVSHVMRVMRAAAPGILGLSTLSLRNSSQGWSTTQTVYLRAV